jgi:hypothetical protein
MDIGRVTKVNMMVQKKSDKPGKGWVKGKKRGLSKSKIPVTLPGYDKDGHKIGEVSLLPVVHHQSISITGILKKQEMGLTLPEIAQAFDVSVATINRALRDYRAAVGVVKEFKGVRGNVLADLQRRILTSITDLDIKKAPFGTKVLAFCQLFDKERLENDQSTANIATLHDDIAALKRKM